MPSRHITSRDLTSRDLTSRDLTSRGRMSRYLTSRDLTVSNCPARAARPRPAAGRSPRPRRAGTPPTPALPRRRRLHVQPHRRPRSVAPAPPHFVRDERYVSGSYSPPSPAVRRPRPTPIRWTMKRYVNRTWSCAVRRPRPAPLRSIT